jgi:segregation and condensation protein B
MPVAFPSWSTAPWQYPAASGHRLAPLWKAHDGQEHAASAGPLARDPQLAQLEAYLFATPEPLSIRRLASLIKQATADDIKRQLKKLASLYDQQGSAWQLVELAGGYQLRTREAFLPWLLKLQPAATLHLSPAARETLAIVAYRQPINRADLEAIRGVSCMEVLRMLLEKNLIRIVGRDKTLGRPVQYGTTKQFLEMMGLKGLQELPPLKE